MDKRWILCLSVILLSLTQIQYAMATGCVITSISSPSASSFQVVWDTVTDASLYLLDIRVVNSTSIAPFVVYTFPNNRMIQGLRPGCLYTVTLKAYRSFTLQCQTTKTSWTVPATSQFTLSEAISSTSLKFEWTTVTGANEYYLVLTDYKTKVQIFNQSFTTTSGRVDGLTPSTTYTCDVYSSNKGGMGARSQSRIIATLVQPPTDVNLEPTSKSTARVTWAAVSNVLKYQVTISDNDDSSIAPVIRRTSATTMDITDLQPCSNYTVGVSSVNNFLVAGEPANIPHTTSTINKVSSISVTYDCTASTVMVTWGEVFGANSYKAMVIDGTGAGLNCTSASTSCTIGSLKCGERYQVRVTAVSDDCESISNTSTFFDTVPCAPANVTAFREECTSNVVVFNWEATHNTLHYVAKSVNSDGVEVYCRTTDTSCHFTNTRCGLSYNYTVYAISTECDSEVSLPTIVHASPCRPTNVRTFSNCQSDNLTTTWDVALGAESYRVEVLGNHGDEYNCTSTGNSCVVADVSCGEHLSVWVTAIAGECANRVLGQAAVTAPCSPTNVSVVVDCDPHSAFVNWTSSNGVVFYIAMAQHANGTVHSCMALQTNCIIKGLDCGQTYNGTVIATNLRCNSTITERVEFTTGPCAPSNVQAVANCTSNHVDISWQNHQLTGSYTAVIQDNNSSQLSCTSNTLNTCEILSVPCGKTYNVTVTYTDGLCSPVSTPINLNSVLCAPENVSASIICPNTAHVSWVGSLSATVYNVTALGQDGHIHDCNTNSTSCHIPNMPCGQNYTITVTPYADLCAGNPSSSHHFSAGPCSPSNVHVSTECGASTVSWSPAPGAQTYIATATAPDGHNHTCNSSSANSCSFTDLHCGENYSVTVVAVDRGCYSEPSLAVELKTGPCAPSNVQAVANCTSNHIDISWQNHQLTLLTGSYTAVIQDHNSSQLSCTSNTLNTCEILSVPCGKTYNVTVTYTDGLCSPVSTPINMNSVPCAPENVSASIICPNTAHVSWVGSLSATATVYNVTALGQDGHIHDCNTNSTSCHIPNMPCGQSYTITVTPYADLCAGNPSSPHHFSAGPCSPTNVHVSTECGVSSVSWSPAPGAQTYIATATAPDGHNHTCNSSSANSCSFTDLHCGENYSVTVVAVDRGCHSEPSLAVELKTVPCVPTNISISADYINNTAVVSWSASKGAVQYFVSVWSSQGNAACLPSDLNCTLTNITCGSNYTVDVKAINGNCSSDPSQALIFSSVPCPPQNVLPWVDCSSDTMMISWDPSTDDLNYTAFATGDGRVLSCTSSNNTCSVEGLPCGKTFSVQVMAHTEYCDSQLSLPVNISSAPCKPQNISGSMDCLTNTATISWDSALGAEMYTVTAVGGDHATNCTTSSTTCMLDDLACGVLYTFCVCAANGLCDSRPSTDIQLQTAPCQPVNLSVEYNCASQSAQLSWTPANGAVEYIGCAQDDSGDMLCCDSFETNCTIEGLQCGDHYNFTVLASDGTCNSSVSDTIRIGAAPCPPDGVEVRLLPPQLQRQWLRFSWTQVRGCSNVQYLLTMTGSLLGDNQAMFDLSSYWTTSTAFEMPLPCGSNFLASVGSSNCGGISVPSRTISGFTAPCPPTGVTYSGNFSSATVSWNASVHAVTYKVYDDSVSPRSQLCSTGSLTCSVTNVSSSHLVITSGNVGGESGGTRVTSGRKR